MTAYRSRMRAAGLRPIQLWVSDTRARGFRAKCRAQAEAIARGDPAGEDIMQFIAATTA